MDYVAYTQYYEQEIQKSLSDSKSLIAKLKQCHEPKQFSNLQQRITSKLLKAEKQWNRYRKLDKKLSREWSTGSSVGASSTNNLYQQFKNNTKDFRNQIQNLKNVLESVREPVQVKPGEYKLRDQDEIEMEIQDNEAAMLLGGGDTSGSDQLSLDADKLQLMRKRQQEKEERQQAHKEKIANELFAEIWKQDEEINEILDRLLSKAKQTNEIADACNQIIELQNAQLRAIDQEMDKLGDNFGRWKKETQNFMRSIARMKCVVITVIILACCGLWVLIAALALPHILKLVNAEESNAGGGGAANTTSILEHSVTSQVNQVSSSILSALPEANDTRWT